MDRTFWLWSKVEEVFAANKVTLFYILYSFLTKILSCFCRDRDSCDWGGIQIFERAQWCWHHPYQPKREWPTRLHRSAMHSCLTYFKCHMFIANLFRLIFGPMCRSRMILDIYSEITQRLSPLCWKSLRRTNPTTQSKTTSCSVSTWCWVEACNVVRDFERLRSICVVVFSGVLTCHGWLIWKWLKNILQSISFSSCTLRAAMFCETTDDVNLFKRL